MAAEVQARASQNDPYLLKRQRARTFTMSMAEDEEVDVDLQLRHVYVSIFSPEQVAQHQALKRRRLELRALKRCEHFEDKLYDDDDKYEMSSSFDSEDEEDYVKNV